MGGGEMNKLSNGSESAFATSAASPGFETGLTKREYMATVIMAGVISHHSFDGRLALAAQDAVAGANELLAKLEVEK
jgi:hypothetical protein